jgi:orotate phosphoribosyltransferase
MTGKRKLIGALKDCGAVQFGEFVLTSGKKSNYYVNLKKATTIPEVLGLITDSVAEVVGDTDKIGGPELGAVPIVVAVSLKIGKPFVIIRKKPKGHGASSHIEGDIEKGEKVVVIEDVTTTAGSLAKAIRILREAGAVVERAVVVVDREEGGRATVENENVEFVSLITATDLIE